MSKKVQLNLGNFLLMISISFLFPIKGTTQIINKDSSLVSFKISNLGINTVEGIIKGFDGTVLFDTKDMGNSSFNVCIDPATINTGISARDRALLEEEYFNVERYPRVCYKSEKIIISEDGFLSVGTLTVKGTSRKISIPFVSEENKLTGSFEINRSEFGVGPKSGFLVGKTVELKIVCVLENPSP
jgi:polyisoprenoid-binding protein YceI